MNIADKIKDDRIYTGNLILAVVSLQVSVKEALDNFPKDSEDDSLKAAWHAITHFEADEDIRAKDPEYAKEQNLYLEMLAEMLKNGDELPINIINEYKEFYQDAYLPTFKNTLKRLFRFIN